MGVSSFHHAYSGIVASFVLFFYPQNYLTGPLINSDFKQICNQCLPSAECPRGNGPFLSVSFLPALYGNACFPLFSARDIIRLIDTVVLQFVLTQ